MPLINCKVCLELNWIEDCILSSARNSIFAITDAKLYGPIVTLSTKDSANLTKQTKDLKDLFTGIVMRQNLQK